MATLTSTRASQDIQYADFVFNFSDRMVPISGGTAIAGTTQVDFGQTNVAATVFEVINLPPNSVVVGGSWTTETAFDTASYAVTIGDSSVANRYLASTDLKAAAHTPLVPTGYRNVSGLNLRIGLTNADVCTTGKATLRVHFIITDRAKEVIPT